MARHLLQRYLPSAAQIRANRLLRPFAGMLSDPNLWHLNRRSASAAAFVGLFCAFIPLPVQMVLAAMMAAVLRCNLPMAVALVWITNPVTIPPMFFFSYKVGAWLLGRQPRHVEIQLTMSWLSEQIGTLWQPLLLGSLVCAVVFGTLGFIGMRLFWRMNVAQRWRARRPLKPRAGPPLD